MRVRLVILQTIIIISFLSLSTGSLGSDESPVDSSDLEVAQGSAKVTEYQEIRLFFTDDPFTLSKDTMLTYQIALEAEGFNTSHDALAAYGTTQPWSPLATLSKGNSSVAVMNYMGYSAYTIGSQLLDLTPKSAKSLLNTSNMPFIAANVVYKENGSIPDYTTPYRIQNLSGVKVGYIGLLSRDLADTTHPRVAQELVIQDYEATVRNIMPSLVSQGVHVVVLLTNLDETSLENLAAVTSDLNISCYVGDFDVLSIDDSFFDPGVLLSTPGNEDLLYLRFRVNVTSGESFVVGAGMVAPIFEPNSYDLGLNDLITSYEVSTNLTQVVGATNSSLSELEVTGMVADALRLSSDDWDFSFAICNAFYNPKLISTGNITYADLVPAVNPADRLVSVNLTGRQLIGVLWDYLLYPANLSDSFVVSGLGWKSGSVNVFTIGNDTLDPTATYQGVMPDSLWYRYFQTDFYADRKSTEVWEATVTFVQKLGDVSHYQWYQPLQTEPTDPETITSISSSTTEEDVTVTATEWEHHYEHHYEDDDGGFAFLLFLILVSVVAIVGYKKWKKKEVNWSHSDDDGSGSDRKVYGHRYPDKPNDSGETVLKANQQEYEPSKMTTPQFCSFCGSRVALTDNYCKNCRSKIE